MSLVTIFFLSPCHMSLYAPCRLLNLRNAPVSVSILAVYPHIGGALDP